MSRRPSAYSLNQMEQQLIEEQLKELAQSAALTIAENTDAASAALRGPRFMFQEYVDEQAEVIYQAMLKVPELLRPTVKA